VVAVQVLIVVVELVQMVVQVVVVLVTVEMEAQVLKDMMAEKRLLALVVAEVAVPVRLGQRRPAALVATVAMARRGCRTRRRTQAEVVAELAPAAVELRGPAEVAQARC